MLKCLKAPCKTFFLSVLEGRLRQKSMGGLSNSLHFCNNLAEPLSDWDCEDAVLYCSISCFYAFVFPND